MSDAAVDCAGVWKFYGDYPALRNISFEVPAGRCLALIGRNGAGKTTLLRILAGFSRAGRGEVRILGSPPRETATRARIGFLGHGISIYDELSALENLRLFARIYGLSNADKASLDWLERTGLAHVKDSLVREFSRGMRQRLAVARAFLHNPSVMLLDEPFTSLDDRAIALLQSLLSDALREGCTIVMSTHQLREALELATDVALIQRGAVAHYGERTTEMLADPGWLYRQYGEA
jgi:heme ABC exporter ATP-binding subunit CcmA